MQGFADAETQTGNDRRPPLTAACDRSLLHSALKRCRQRQVSTAVKQIELDKPQNRRSVARMYGQAREALKIRQNRGNLGHHFKTSASMMFPSLFIVNGLSCIRARTRPGKRNIPQLCIACIPCCSTAPAICTPKVAKQLCALLCASTGIPQPRLYHSPPVLLTVHSLLVPAPCCPTFADSSIQF